MCRQRQYVDRGRRRRRKNGVKSCSDAAARPGRSRPAPWKLERMRNALFTTCTGASCTVVSYRR
eukprot:6566161-Prymnesium_polylepis.2